MRTIYAVCCEDDSSGAVDWYLSRSAADNRFDYWVQEFLALPDEPQWINMFKFEVDDDMPDEEITELADEKMWEMDYTAIRTNAKVQP